MIRRFILLPLAIVLCPPAQAQNPLNVGGGGAVDLPGLASARFTLDGARYAMAIAHSSPMHVPTAREKLLIVEYTVENVDEQGRHFPVREIKLTAVDTDSQFGDAQYAGTTDVRLFGTDRPGGDNLRPGQSRKVYQGIFVNADSSIDTLLVTRGSSAPAVIALADRIEPLPPELAGPDGNLPEMIPAQFGRRYVVGAYDLQVEAAERRAMDGNARDELIVVPVSIHNRVSDDWRLDRGMLPAYVTDANGERHELRTLWKAESDTPASLNLAPGQTVTVRLHFVVPAAFQPSQLALLSRSGRGPSHRLMFPLGPLVGADAIGPVLGKYDPAATGSGGATGGSGIASTSPVFTPTRPPEADIAESAARIHKETFGSTSREPASTPAYSPTGPDLSGLEAPVSRPLEFPEGGTGAAATTDPAEEDAATTASAPFQAKVRHATFDLQSMTFTREHENAGDEYYLVTYAFRGLRGAGDRIVVFDASRQIRPLLPGDNWAVNGKTVQIPGDVGRLEFRDLQPYEVYGFVAVVMEADGNTEAERAAAFGWGEFQNEDGVLEVLSDLFNRSVPRDGAKPDYDALTCEVVAEVDRLNRLGLAIHFGTDSPTGTTAQAIKAALAEPMKRPDPDDFDGWFFGFFSNLPGDGTCLADGGVGTRWYPKPGPILYYTPSTRVQGEHRLYE